MLLWALDLKLFDFFSTVTVVTSMEYEILEEVFSIET